MALPPTDARAIDASGLLAAPCRRMVPGERGAEVLDNENYTVAASAALHAADAPCDKHGIKTRDATNAGATP
jgi:hypothetical protein